MLFVFGTTLAIGMLGGCATSDDPARIRFLEAEQTTRNERLRVLQQERDADVRRLEAKKSALRRAEAKSAWLVGGELPYIAIHRDHIGQMIANALPVTLENDGYHFVIDDHTLHANREGIYLSLSYQAKSSKLSGITNGTAQGEIRGILQLKEIGTPPQLVVQFQPEELSVDNRHFRAIVPLREQLELHKEIFAALIPPIPFPVAMATSVDFNGKKVEIKVQYHLDDYLILSNRMVVPYQIHIQ